MPRKSTGPVLSALAFCLLIPCLPASGAAATWSVSRGGYTLHWDLQKDIATLAHGDESRTVWRGPLLPGFQVYRNGQRQFVKAELDVASRPPAADGGELSLRLPELGRARLSFSAESWGIRFRELRVEWDVSPVAMIGLYFGSAPLTDEQRTLAPSLEHPFWPAWTAEGYCVPSGKGGPVQSFFRSWDLGHATFPLGSYGPSLGTPYAAAFPRPLFSAAMGGREGWMAFGSGAIPDAAMLFEIRATTGTLHYLYREDLWGAPNGRTRIWQDPIRIAWAPAAWDAFQRLFGSFGPKPASPIHQQSHWNTWGNFRDRRYDLREEADRAASFGAQVVVIDDGWESSTGSGVPRLGRFPQFPADLRYIRSKGLSVGFWLTAGWIADPDAAGLTDDDLLLGKDGRRRRATWNMAPADVAQAKYCLDPSSRRAREFLRTRVLRIMRELDPQVLKLDFGYGLPGPDVSVPRNPALRGERLAFELLRITAEAAREVKPDVTIQYYSIHPLMRSVTDVVALDDLGDAGGHEVEAHSQWSVWSALAAVQGAAIQSSSGYDWSADAEILLDTAVIGAPGSVLPLPRPGQPPLSEALTAPRQALMRWYRRTTGWEPLWLNSTKGSIGHEPQMRCFGRIEGPNQRLTALVLREAKPTGADAAPLRGMNWRGRWALIAQDDAGIFNSDNLACIPFDAGFIELPLDSRPSRVVAVRAGREEPVADWKYVDGRLRLEVPPGGSPLSGFLVVRGPNR